MTVTVLIVDDQAPFRSVARTVVQLTDGFDVVAEAEDGETAVTMARGVHPDLVLMDANLPGIDGLEATRQILAERGGGRPVVIVVLSTYEASEFASQAISAGASSFITKAEFSPERLVEAWKTAGPV